MNTSIMKSLLMTVVVGFAGCTSPSPQTFVQSALADTHLGWQPAPEHQLSYELATTSGIARVELRPLPQELQRLTLDLPGMQQVEGVQWRGENGENAMLYDGAGGPEGISLKRRGHGFRLQIEGPALDLVRDGGELTVIDYYRG